MGIYTTLLGAGHFLDVSAVAICDFFVVRLAHSKIYSNFHYHLSLITTVRLI